MKKSFTNSLTDLACLSVRLHCLLPSYAKAFKATADTAARLHNRLSSSGKLLPWDLCCVVEHLQCEEGEPVSVVDVVALMDDAIEELTNLKRLGVVAITQSLQIMKQIRQEVGEVEKTADCIVMN